MIRMLLTSSGFENSLLNIYKHQFRKYMYDVKVLFIPTAANTDDAKQFLPKCKDDLLRAGVTEDNIIVYDLDREMSLSEIMQYDSIYVCGGSSKYLISRIVAMNMLDTFIQAIRSGIVYVGVSAGSIICTSSVEPNLGIIPNKFKPHCTSDITFRKLHQSISDELRLSDGMAAYVYGELIQIV